MEFYFSFVCPYPCVIDLYFLNMTFANFLLKDLSPFCEEASSSSNVKHQNPAADRQAKINRYRQTKEFKTNIVVKMLYSTRSLF